MSTKNSTHQESNLTPEERRVVEHALGDQALSAGERATPGVDQDLLRAADALRSAVDRARVATPADASTTDRAAAASALDALRARPEFQTRSGSNWNRPWLLGVAASLLVACLVALFAATRVWFDSPAHGLFDGDLVGMEREIRKADRREPTGEVVGLLPEGGGHLYAGQRLGFYLFLLSAPPQPVEPEWWGRLALVAEDAGARPRDLERLHDVLAATARAESAPEAMAFVDGAPVIETLVAHLPAARRRAVEHGYRTGYLYHALLEGRGQALAMDRAGLLEELEEEPLLLTVREGVLLLRGRTAETGKIIAAVRKILY